MNPRPWLALVLAATLHGAAAARTAHDETFQGDLSDQGAGPTAVQLEPGDNDLVGSTGVGIVKTDRDYLRFTVAPGLQWTALTVLPGTQPAGGVSFVALQAGPAVTVNPAQPNPAPLLGWAHFSEVDLGSNLLTAMGSSPSAIGFSAPLPAGHYALWIQDTNVGIATYALRVTVSPVPEPASAGMAVAGVLLLAAWRRRRAATA